MRSISCLVLPIPDHVFFEQTVFERQFSDDLLQCAGLAAQILYLVRGCCAGRIAGEPLLPGLKEVFRPAVIQILDDPFTTAQLGDALLAAQALQHNADLLFCRELPACRPPDVLHDLFRRFLHRPGFLSHLRSLKGYDEPEILPSSTRPICLIGADGGHQDHWEDPVADEIRGFIGALNEDEQIDLVALAWLGRGEGTIDDWGELRAEAARITDHSRGTISSRR